MKEIENIISILEKAQLCFTRKQMNIYIRQLKKLTEKIWNENYKQLLIELKKDDKLAIGVDYQIYWYECMGYLNSVGPLARDFNGNTIGICGGLDSDFNKIAGYHDANINFVKYDNEYSRLSIFLDLFGKWGIIDEENYNCTVSFGEISTFYINKSCGKFREISHEELVRILIGKPVISIKELPAIDYFLLRFGIDSNDEIISNRMFRIFLGMNGPNEPDEIIVLAKSWEQLML